MKRLLFLLSLLSASSALAQTEPVVKHRQTKALTDSIVIKSGTSITINSGASIINNGTATGFGSGGSFGTLTGVPADNAALATALGLKANTADLGALATLSAVTSTTITDATIANADIASNASVAFSKLAALTASRLAVTDASGVLTASAVTSAEAAHLSGVTSALQDQLDAKLATATAETTYAPLDSPHLTGTTTIDIVSITNGLANLSGLEIDGTVNPGAAFSFDADNGWFYYATPSSGTARLVFPDVAVEHNYFLPTIVGGGSSTLVLTDQEQTLTGKNISGASNTISGLSASNISSGTLPVARGGTGITSFGTGVAAWLGTPSKANLSAAVSDDDPAYIGTANTFTAAQTVSVGTNSATPVLGRAHVNPTAAIAGTQSASPLLTLTGQGWKTTATAASQSVSFGWHVLPVQGTTAPTGLLKLGVDINATGTYTDRFHFGSDGTFYLRGGGSASMVSFQGSGATTTLAANGYGDGLTCSGNFTCSIATIGGYYFRGAYIGQMGSGASLAWSDNADGAAGTLNVKLVRDGANGVLAQKLSGYQQKLRVYDSGATKYTEVTHDGTNSVITASSGSLTIVVGGSTRVTVNSSGEVFLNLPASAGTTGSLWNDAGTVKVAP